MYGHHRTAGARGYNTCHALLVMIILKTGHTQDLKDIHWFHAEKMTSSQVLNIYTGIYRSGLTMYGTNDHNRQQNKSWLAEVILLFDLLWEYRKSRVSIHWGIKNELGNHKAAYGNSSMHSEMENSQYNSCTFWYSSYWPVSIWVLKGDPYIIYCYLSLTMKLVSCMARVAVWILCVFCL